ncbi:hypothetical protein [Brevibacillus sp. NRS-1366]|uniref:hypothetical protein n=1 Tax=Brevibacillus sp. NRS-1366 TaxID=3233899 RepID=UPI003D1CF9AC
MSIFRKSVNAVLIGIGILYMVMEQTVPSGREYQEWLISEQRINCDARDCIHSTLDPMGSSTRTLPFLMIAKTEIYDDTDNSIKVLGVFKTFIILKNQLKRDHHFKKHKVYEESA